MDIASGIFWVMLGLLYILYQAFKERPEDTLACVMLCGIIVGAIIAWGLLFHALIEMNVIVGGIFGMGSIIGGTAWLLIYCDRSEKKRKESLEAYFRRCDKAREIVSKEVYDEWTLREYAKTWVEGHSERQHLYKLLAEKNSDLVKDPLKMFGKDIEDSYRNFVRFNEVLKEITKEEEAAEKEAKNKK